MFRKIGTSSQNRKFTKSEVRKIGCFTKSELVHKTGILVLSEQVHKTRCFAKSEQVRKTRKMGERERPQKQNSTPYNMLLWERPLPDKISFIYS